MEENAQVKVSAIIVAAGASRRMGFDKLSYRLPGGKTVLDFGQNIAGYVEFSLKAKAGPPAGGRADPCGRR